MDLHVWVVPFTLTDRDLPLFEEYLMRYSVSQGI